MGKYDPSPKRKTKRRTTRAKTRSPKRTYRRRTYDPKKRRTTKTKKRSRRAKAKGFMAKIGNFFYEHGEFIGFGLGFGIPTYLAKQKQPSKPWGAWLIDGVKDQVSCLMGDNPSYTTESYLTHKFTSEDSHWRTPFLGSIIGLIVSSIANKIAPSKFKKYIKPLPKIFTGSLIASIIGGLFMLGSPKTPTSNTSTSTNTNALSYYG